MKPIGFVLAAAMLVGTSAYAAPKPATQSFRGEIMDSACASMGRLLTA